MVRETSDGGGRLLWLEVKLYLMEIRWCTGEVVGEGKDVAGDSFLRGYAQGISDKLR